MRGSCVLVLAGALLSRPAAAQTKLSTDSILITFEEGLVAPSVFLTTQYSTAHVTFDSAAVAIPSSKLTAFGAQPHSPTHWATPCYSAEHCPTTYVIRFDRPIHRVAVWVSLLVPIRGAARVQLTALDSQQRTLFQQVTTLSDTPAVSGPQRLEVTDTASTITSVRLQMGRGGSPVAAMIAVPRVALAFDDLEFDWPAPIAQPPPTPQAPVPSVLKLDSAGAVARLASRGFTLGRVEHSSTSKYPSGRIFHQLPQPSDLVDTGSAVAVTIADSVLIKVPNLLKLDWNQAQERVLKAGLTATRPDTVRAEGPIGTVYHQHPDPGTPVSPGYKVEISVIIGPILPPPIPRWVWVALAALPLLSFAHPKVRRVFWPRVNVGLRDLGLDGARVEMTAPPDQTAEITFVALPLTGAEEVFGPPPSIEFLEDT